MDDKQAVDTSDVVYTSDDDGQSDEVCGIFSSNSHSEETKITIRMRISDDCRMSDIDYDPTALTYQGPENHSYRRTHGYGATDSTPSRRCDSSDGSLTEESETETELTPFIISIAAARPTPLTVSNSSLFNAWAKTAANIIAPTLPIATIIVTGTTSIIALSTGSASIQSASAVVLSLLNVAMGFLASVITLTYGYNKQTEQEKGARGKFNVIRNSLRKEADAYNALERHCTQNDATTRAINACQSSITQHYESRLGSRYIWATAGFSIVSSLHPTLAIAAFGTGFNSPIVSFGLNLGASVAGAIVLALYSSAYRNWESRRIRLKNTSLENLSDILAINSKDCVLALLLASSHSPCYEGFMRTFDEEPTTYLLKEISEASIRDTVVAVRVQVVTLANAMAGSDVTPAQSLEIQSLLCGMIENYATISEQIESLEVKMTGHASTTQPSGSGELRALAQALRAKNNAGKLFGAEPQEIEQIRVTSDAVNARFGRIEKRVTALNQIIERQEREIKDLKVALETTKAESAAALEAVKTESAAALEAVKTESAAALEAVKTESATEIAALKLAQQADNQKLMIEMRKEMLAQQEEMVKRLDMRFEKRLEEQSRNTGTQRPAAPPISPESKPDYETIIRTSPRETRETTSSDKISCTASPSDG